MAGRDGIYVLDIDGTAFRRLTKVNESPGGFSPDGKRLVYVRPETGQLGFINADGSGDHLLEMKGAQGVAWMPDGRLYASIDGVLVLLSDQGKRERQIFALNGQAVEPRLSPDGRRLVFSFDLNDPNVCCMSIATINLDGSGFTEIVPTTPGAEQVAPDWRPTPR